MTQTRLEISQSRNAFLCREHGYLQEHLSNLLLAEMAPAASFKKFENYADLQVYP